ncbi:MAG: hypothetical protein HOE11_04870 [Candidatus Diapherotrites archaeon]|jgi:hypothetical protein|nr:hypothetical protein [Candidatus Diapherotrites archaeon]MBT4596980.1 hypothetical protein [Candidatus Diapherotrites archaeon]
MFEMFIWLFALALVGSCSVGYSLLRLIYPEKQDAGFGEKIGYSYGMGLLVFLPGIISVAMLGEKLFFIVSGIVYVILFIAFYIKRKQSGLEDNVELVANNKKTFIPRKVLTDEEKADKEQYNSVSKNNVQVDNRLSQKTIDSVKVKEQLFKEKQPNVIAKLREKTLNIETQKKEEDREKTLAKLKSLERSITKKKIGETDELEEINETELEGIGKDF